MLNKTRPPGQGQVPMGSRSQPEVPVRTPDADDQELAGAQQCAEMPDQQVSRGSAGHPSGRTAGREDVPSEDGQSDEVEGKPWSAIAYWEDQIK